MPPLRRPGWMIGLAGLTAGALSVLTPGGVFVAAVASGIFFLFRRFVNPPDRRFVAILFAAGFCLRAAASLGLDAAAWRLEGEISRKTGPVKEWDLGVVDKSRSFLRTGDSDYYSQRGYALSQYARGVREPVAVFRINQYGWNGYVYVIGWFYHLFGYSPYAVKLINGLLGALLGPLIFFIARSCFNPTVARWAALGVCFFPSMLLWSVTNLKDIPLVFLTLLALLLYERMRQSGPVGLRLLKYGGPLIGTLLLHAAVRSAVFTWLLVAGLILAYGAERIRFKPWQGIGLAVAAAGSLALNPVGLCVRRFLASAFHWHIGFVTTAGIGYRFLPAPFYGPESRQVLQEWTASGGIGGVDLAAILLRATAHYLLEPIPGLREPAFEWVVWLQMMVWYLALVFSAIGALWSLRHKLRQTLFLLIPMGLWTLAGATSNGNVGTLFRMRDMVTPFYLMFACLGGWLLFRERQAAGIQ